MISRVNIKKNYKIRSPNDIAMRKQGCRCMRDGYMWRDGVRREVGYSDALNKSCPSLKRDKSKQKTESGARFKSDWWWFVCWQLVDDGLYVGSWLMMVCMLVAGWATGQRIHVTLQHLFTKDVSNLFCLFPFSFRSI